MGLLHMTLPLERRSVPESGDSDLNSDLNSGLNLGIEWVENIKFSMSLSYGGTKLCSET